jgi:hypothetical protein
MTCTCDICGKEIARQRDLMRHKQSKKCQALGKKISTSSRKCDCGICGRSVLKKHIRRHYKTKRCKEIARLKEEILKLKTDAKNKSSITNNNNINITNNIVLTPMSLEKFLTSESVRKAIRENNFMEKGKGIASAIISLINQKEENITRYICDDSSRVKCRYKNLEGQIVKDVKGKKLWDACKEPVKDRVNEIRKDLSRRLPMCSDKWSECAQPVLGADILPPPGFSTFLSTVV